ncbi:MAG: hypothetical protein A2451_02830 [Bdellovibrionales bacterium RIFOXYC2_FULL_39_8]|nr:MAG: hypothetical protein A2451_02830 [Bdellovibrionales bacterium RIFOXYC2_FULL_39_8]
MLQVEAAQKLIGIALFDMIEADNCAHLLKIAVDPQFRQRQIAAKILQEAFSFIGKTEQFLKIYLEVEEQNKVAIKLYQRAGFSAIHRLRNFYGQGKDGLAMIRFMKK